MKISPNKLLKIADSYRKDNLEDYILGLNKDLNEGLVDCYVDLFDDSEWDEIEQAIIDENYCKDYNTTDKKQRISILVNGIKNQRGLQYVNSELTKVGLKEVYVRNFHELILYWCFKNNDDNSEYKVGAREYIRIKKKCYMFNETQRELMNTYDKLNTFSGKITLRMIREYVENNSKKSEDMELCTKSITFHMKEEINRLDISNLGEEQLCDTIFGLAQSGNNLMNLTSKCEKTRYYFVKYLQYFIEYHIQEFIDLLNEFSNMTIEQLEKLINDEELDNSSYLPWSVKKTVFDMLTAADYKDNIFGQEKRLVLIMQIVSQAVCLEGTPLCEDNVSPLLKTSEGKLKSWSDIKNIGHIFRVSKSDVIENDKQIIDEQKQQMRKLEFQNLTVENFIDYPIKISALANMIFQIDKDVLDNKSLIENQKDRLINAIQGNAEISRDVLLYFIMMMDQMFKDKPRQLPSNEKLTEARVNNILSKCGFEVMSGRNIMDYLVKKTLNLTNVDFSKKIIPLFGEMCVAEKRVNVVYMDNEALSTYEANLDKKLSRKI